MPSVTFDEINIGDQHKSRRIITRSDIAAFAAVSGDDNPIHLSDAFAQAAQFGGIIAHGMLVASSISKSLGTELPGYGTTFLGLNNLKFLKPVSPGDEITTTITVTKKHDSKPIVWFDCALSNQNGEPVITAEAVVKAPVVKAVMATPQSTP